MEKFETPPDSPPIITIDPDDQPMWSDTRTFAPTPSSAIVQLVISNYFHIKGTRMQMIRDNQFNGRIRSDPHRHVADFLKISSLFQYDVPTQEILDAGGIFLYNTPNEAFKILEDKVLLKLDFSGDSQNSPKPKTVVSTGGNNIDPYHGILMENIEALARKTDSEFLNIRKELKEMRYSQEMMGEWMSMQMEANERMKNQMVELERKINQGLRNRQAIIENFERQFKYLETIQPTESLSRTTNTKQRQEFVYTPPSIQNENDKDTVLPNHVGGKELKSIDGVGTRRMTKTKIKKNDKGMPKESNKEWKLNEKAVPHNNEVYHYIWHPTEITHLNRIIKKS
nr:reverse transcriptase domain-containing protein [Tanacetum cinerariifolium]